MGLYGLRKPGVHNTGPVVSEHGFRTGKRGNTTEVIKSNGRIPADVLLPSLTEHDIMLGGTIDGKSNDTHTIFVSDGNDQYDVVISAKVTEAFEANDGVIATVEVGYETEDDGFGTLETPVAVGFDQTFSGRSGEGNNITIKVSDWETDATGEFTYICVASKVE